MKSPAVQTASPRGLVVSAQPVRKLLSESSAKTQSSKDLDPLQSTCRQFEAAVREDPSAKSIPDRSLEEDVKEPLKPPIHACAPSQNNNVPPQVAESSKEGVLASSQPTRKLLSESSAKSQQSTIDFDPLQSAGRRFGATVHEDPTPNRIIKRSLEEDVKEPPKPPIHAGAPSQNNNVPPQVAGTSKEERN